MSNELKWRRHKRILEAGGERVCRPRRLVAASTMTVAQWGDKQNRNNGPWLAFDDAGKLDLDKTVENLKAAENVLKNAVET